MAATSDNSAVLAQLGVSLPPANAEGRLGPYPGVMSSKGIHYHVFEADGEEQGIVLWVHGIGDFSYSAKPVALRLQQAGFRVITFDFRGRGWSAPLYVGFIVAWLACVMVCVVWLGKIRGWGPVIQINVEWPIFLDVLGLFSAFGLVWLAEMSLRCWLLGTTTVQENGSTWMIT